MTTRTHRGHEYTVYREENYRDSLRNPHEFILEIDGEQVKTATQLEQEGVSHDDYRNWTAALIDFAEDYIDKLEAQTE